MTSASGDVSLAVSQPLSSLQGVKVAKLLPPPLLYKIQRCLVDHVFPLGADKLKKKQKYLEVGGKDAAIPLLSLSLSLPSLYVCACIIPRKLLALPSSVCANQSVFPLAGAVSYGCTEWNNEPLWTKGQNKRRIPFSSCIGFWLSWIIHKLTALSLSLYISLSFWFISQPHNSLIYAPVGGFSSKTFC